MGKFRNGLQYLIQDPKKFLRIFALYVFRLPLVRDIIPDIFVLKLVYFQNTGKKLNLSNPVTFNDKVQWLKLYDRNPMYTRLVDKYEVRGYITETIGQQYLIPLIGVYNRVDDIPFSELPDQYVLKCTHDSGTAIVKNLDCTLTENEIKEKLRKSLKRNYYYEQREWPYKFVKPRIICEKYMVDESNVELKDYKIHCFYGKPKLIQVDFGRFTNHHRNLYDTEWNYIHASILYPNDPDIRIKKPSKLGRMLDLASTLSNSFPYVRVDLYVIKDEIYFGELTFYHGGGYEDFNPEELEIQMGEWIKLPQKYNC